MKIKTPKLPSLEQRMEWDYDKKERELQIGRMRASVVRNQITEAYTILENIRFDFLGDTAFRDKIVSAKKGIERAFGDFLLSDDYWKDNQEKHRKLTPKEFHKIISQSGQGKPTA